jgi:glycosyltransferase involved in cell wall biosynthesis
VHIAVISSWLPPETMGGAEAYAAELSASLASRHELLVLSSTHDAAVAGAGVRPLPALPPWDKSDSVARKAVWHLRDQWRPAVYRALTGELARFRPDVVHSHALQGLSAAPLSAVRSLGLPHVHTAHDFSLICMETKMTRREQPCGRRCAKCLLQRRVRGGAAARGLTRFIAPSRFLLDRHLEAGVIDSGRAEVIPHGARDARERVRGERPEELSLGFIGTLSRDKGVLTLLRAFAGAPAGWRLKLAGAGALADQVRAAAAADRRIEYLGHVRGSDKNRFFDDIDLLVVPSENEENAPLVVVEAAVRGVPTLVSDRGGLPESPEATVFAAGDDRALRDAATALAPKLAETSRRLISRKQEFLWEPHVRSVERVLEHAAGGIALR